MHSKSFLIFLLILIVAIAKINYLAEINYWYWEIRWFDWPMHFAGGVWLAGITVWWRHLRHNDFPPQFHILLRECLVFTIIIGLGWEIFDGVLAFINKEQINEIVDTTSDLFFDMLGGMTLAIFVWYGKHD